MTCKPLLALLFFFAVSASLSRAEDYAQNWRSALAWMKTQANDDASFCKKKGARVGYSSLVLQAWNSAPAAVRAGETDFAALMQKTADWIASQQNSENGYIADGPEYHNYSTSLAICALARFDEKKYAPVIQKALAYLKGLQANVARRFDPAKHITFGGFGYGSTLRPDLSNTWFALSALSAGGLAQKDQAYTDAVVFIKRCQNSSEVNDQPYAGTDGGAMYLPDDSAAGKSTTRDGKKINKSFGSMTAAMLSGYLYCGLQKDAKPVELAAKWLGNNFSVQKNPEHQKDGQQALYYYYRALATALQQYGEANFFGHNWKNELSAELLKSQHVDGYWVNKEARFSENDPVLCTAYALYALGLCSK